MTRFTKLVKRKHLDATPWSEMKKHAQCGDSDDSDHSTTDDEAEQQIDQTKEPAEPEEKTESKATVEKEDSPSELKQINEDKQSDKPSSSGVSKRKEKQEKMKLARKIRRQKMKRCFSCRERGHSVKDCPLVSATDSRVCYHCASAEHTTKNCPHAPSDNSKSLDRFSFATCFICKEKGHIARACPKNPRGLYPDGGGCKMCGSVEHFKKDCPEFQVKKKGQKGNSMTIAQHSSSYQSVDSLDEVMDEPPVERVPKKTKKKIVKF